MSVLGIGARATSTCRYPSRASTLELSPEEERARRRAIVQPAFFIPTRAPQILPTATLPPPLLAMAQMRGFLTRPRTPGRWEDTGLPSYARRIRGL